jgi:hypothetical protein
VAAFRADARAKIAVQADELRIRGWQYVGGGGVGSPTPVALATPAPQGTAAGGRPPDATDTNTQVPGVDEADVVEVTGDRIYLLRGSELVALTATPPTALAIADRIPIEGYPVGMFVADGRGLVVSQVYDNDGALGGDRSCGAIGAPFPEAPWIAGSVPFGFSCTPVFTKVTLVDVTMVPATVVRELYLEGRYIGARRHDRRARVIVERDWGTPPSLPNPWDVIWTPSSSRDPVDFVAAVDTWEHDALAAIDASVLADWMPVERERIDGALVDHAPACENVYAPPTGLARQGTTLIAGFDLDAANGPIDDTLLVGDTSTIYANADTLVLADPGWQDEPLGGASLRTALHVFALAEDETKVSYLGSGFVPGSLLSQFALDVSGDVVRVATTYWSELTGRPSTRVTTARVDDGALVALGTTEDLAPGEQLQGVRFLGDRAYLVTFVRVDPLFVVDLSDPAHPRTLGEVTLPGFSEYLHPLDDHHLLTIGRAGTDPGQVQGLALRIFDVAEPTAPVLSDEYVLQPNGWSPAETDHLAFTFEPRLGLLALPLNQSEISFTRGTLQLFDVSADTGIHLRGVVDHGVAGRIDTCAPPYDWESCFVSDWMERGLFIDDVVYSIATGDVQARSLDELSTPLAKVSLP